MLPSPCDRRAEQRRDWCLTLCEIYNFRTKILTLKNLMIFCAKDMHKNEVLS
jgi:hypothetical protein